MSTYKPEVEGTLGHPLDSRYFRMMLVNLLLHLVFHLVEIIFQKSENGNSVLKQLIHYFYFERAWKIRSWRRWELVIHHLIWFHFDCFMIISIIPLFF